MGAPCTARHPCARALGPFTTAAGCGGSGGAIAVAATDVTNSFYDPSRLLSHHHARPCRTTWTCMVTTIVALHSCGDVATGARVEMWVCGLPSLESRHPYIPPGRLAIGIVSRSRCTTCLAHLFISSLPHACSFHSFHAGPSRNYSYPLPPCSAQILRVISDVLIVSSCLALAFSRSLRRSFHSALHPSSSLSFYLCLYNSPVPCI
ncbi:hypothetical protein BV20DRAFT_662139 [Pilatotrama ljubarskyi]|nr:hypothetical protein BV20DRAFT_662139 [Pilatotrama ljubarskyi]